MLIDWNKVQIYIKPGITDMRKQINGLSTLLDEETEHDLYSGNLYIFCNRYRNRLKILYWDRNGFCLWLKRLEKNKFPWPRNEEEVKEITHNELKMLLSGIDFFNAHKNINFSDVS
jgi:transposase